MESKSENVTYSAMLGDSWSFVRLQQSGCSSVLLMGLCGEWTSALNQSQGSIWVIESTADRVCLWKKERKKKKSWNCKLKGKLLDLKQKKTAALTHPKHNFPQVSGPHQARAWTLSRACVHKMLATRCGSCYTMQITAEILISRYWQAT